MVPKWWSGSRQPVKRTLFHSSSSSSSSIERALSQVTIHCHSFCSNTSASLSWFQADVSGGSACFCIIWAWLEFWPQVLFSHLHQTLPGWTAELIRGLQWNQVSLTVRAIWDVARWYSCGKWDWLAEVRSLRFKFPSSCHVDWLTEVS